MKILITGKSGYIATNLKKLFASREKSFLVDAVSIRDGLPENLGEYDTVIHCAAAVHGGTRDREEIFRINHDLTVELSEKSKNGGVGHFVFISTMSVYGVEGKLGEKVVVGPDTPCRPVTDYGKSKLAAERDITKLRDENFRVAILRPPMVYGDGCPGNYKRLAWFALRSPVFPYIENQRSMIHIDNLCETIADIVEKKSSGIFLPQDEEYKCTSLLVKKIAEENGKKIYLSPMLGALVKLADISPVRKIFGNLVYSREDEDESSAEACCRI